MTSTDWMSKHIACSKSAEISRPSWSPNGKYVVHDVLNAAGAQSLGITDVGTGEIVMLQGGEGGNNASWSPNGQWIAFDLCPGFAHGCDPRIFVVPATGGVRQLVVNDGVTQQWSHTSKRIVFARPSDGSIMTLDITGEDERPVLSPTPYGGSMNNPDWSPDGQWIVFEWWGYILRVPVNKLGEPVGEMQLVANDFHWNYSPRWSNNTKSIVFGSGNVLWSVPATGGERTQLTFPFAWGDYDPAYSNDGQNIAFSGYSPRSAGKQVAAQDAGRPAEFALEQNYPNPFNPRTTIAYDVRERVFVTIVVYDVLGQEVRTLVAHERDAGIYTTVWDGKDHAGLDVPSGVYLYTMRAGASVQTREMMLTR